MTTFDDDLRLRLARLDAAMPGSVAPVFSTTARRTGPNRRRQGFILLAAAAIALFGLAGLTAVAVPTPPDPAVVARNAADEERLREDLGAAIGGRCLNLEQAKNLFRQRLHALGLDNWAIRDDGGSAESPCTGAAPIGDSHEILVMPSMGGATAEALDALNADLLTRCAGRDEAIAAIRATLLANGIADPRFEVTGIRGVPVEGGDAFVQHVQDGCHVYGGAQFDNHGAYTWYVSGP